MLGNVRLVPFLHVILTTRDTIVQRNNVLGDYKWYFSLQYVILIRHIFVPSEEILIQGDCDCCSIVPKFVPAVPSSRQNYMLWTEFLSLVLLVLQRPTWVRARGCANSTIKWMHFICSDQWWGITEAQSVKPGVLAGEALLFSVWMFIIRKVGKGMKNSTVLYHVKHYKTKAPIKKGKYKKSKKQKVINNSSIFNRLSL